MSFGDWIFPAASQRLQDDTAPDGAESLPDPIEAITETTAQATEAASEFVTWIGSGELTALIALGLVIAFTTAQWLARWAVLKGIVKLPR